MRLMKIGLFFGSFNPIHIGHLAMANYFVEFSDLEKIWMIVSPQNPFKSKNDLLPEDDRYQMVEETLSEDQEISVSDIEFKLPKPSYTIDTLNYLKKSYNSHEFVLIIGSDNLKYFHKWKNHKELIDNYEIYVYPRLGYDHNQYREKYPLTLVDAPFIEISSSFVRSAIAEGKDVRYFVPQEAYRYIKKMHLYEKQ
jgi:nicotinate-nucleotide adenylyltransferase